MTGQFITPEFKPEIVPIIRDPTAGALYGHLKEWIADAEAKLADGERLDLSFVSQAGDRISVSDIDYRHPHFIVFNGCDEQGNNCNVLVHMASVQLILRVVKDAGMTERKRIGFISPVEK